MVLAGDVDHSGQSASWKSHFPQGDIWVFGYGSLIWKPPPHFDQRVPGYIKGYVRRFWQASGDHRGTPESPGRVVTVIERSFWETLSDPQTELEPDSTDSVVWGAAYHIPASHAEEVIAYLDDREIDGYTVHYTPFHPSQASDDTTSTSSQPQPCSSTTSSTLPSSGRDVRSSSGTPQPMTCKVYIGLPTNPQFLRDESQRDPASVAKVISTSRGQSGDNRDYLFQLEEALESLGLGYADGHVADLVDRVKRLEPGRIQDGPSRHDGKPVCSAVGGTSTPDEFEHRARS